MARPTAVASSTSRWITVSCNFGVLSVAPLPLHCAIERVHHGKVCGPFRRHITRREFDSVPAINCRSDAKSADCHSLREHSLNTSPATRSVSAMSVRVLTSPVANIVEADEVLTNSSEHLTRSWAMTRIAKSPSMNFSSATLSPLGIASKARNHQESITTTKSDQPLAGKEMPSNSQCMLHVTDPAVERCKVDRSQTIRNAAPWLMANCMTSFNTRFRGACCGKGGLCASVSLWHKRRRKEPRWRPSRGSEN